MKIPKHNFKSVNEHRFSFFAPSVWNSLVASLLNLPIVSEFKAQLKTVRLRQAFPQISVDYVCMYDDDDNDNNNDNNVLFSVLFLLRSTRPIT